MKITQVKTCFYLLFVAAMVSSNQGDEVVGGNCTSHSDCNFDHGACLKYDQCHLGRCYCDVGYFVDKTNKLCQKLKKVGELCGSRFETCDEGDLCREGVCTSHQQQSGMFGNACSVDSDCRQEPNLICANNVCGCNNDSKIATLNTYGAMFNVCVHHKVILDQKTNDACAPDIFDLKATDKICSPGLFCAFCPEWAISDTYKCLSDNRARRFPRGDLYDNCTSSSDCDYDGAVCFRFDQCQLGMCVCEVGLWPSDVKRCDKPKKIGDPCDEYKDGCYDESFCKNGKCTCGDDQYPSEDKTSCRRKYGETCRADANCTDTLKCIDDKCGCETDRNISTRSYLGRLFESCTPKNITMTLKANEKCDLDLALKHCGPDLTCWRCPESGINGTPKCLSTNGPAISHADNSATTPIIQDGTEPTDTIPKVSANGQLSLMRTTRPQPPASKTGRSLPTPFQKCRAPIKCR